MKRFSQWFQRLFRRRCGRDMGRTQSHRQEHTDHRTCFKSPLGRGPFLLSYDGRVIPLRKARFLRDR